MNKFKLPYINVNNQDRGFITFFTLGLICLLFISVFFILQILNTLDTEKSTLHICRFELLKTQDDVGKDIQHLLDLNQVVRTLHASKKTAKGMIVLGAATLNAPVVAAGERLLVVTLKAEKAMLTLQNFYLQSAGLKMNWGFFQTQQKIKSELQKRRTQQKIGSKSQLSSGLNIGTLHYQLKIPAVRKVPSDEELPEYELENDFSRKQSMHISWNYQHLIGSTKGSLWEKISVKKKLSCSASLESKSTHFQSILIVAKP